MCSQLPYLPVISSLSTANGAIFFFSQKNGVYLRKHVMMFLNEKIGGEGNRIIITQFSD